MRSIVTIALVLATVARTAPGQDDRPARCADEPDSVLADRYAPDLHFAPGERFFPTIPFFSAFDGLNNDRDEDGLADLHDSTEIAPLATDRHGHEGVSADSLEQWYLRTVTPEGRPQRSAVYYRVRCLTRSEVRTLVAFLRGDDQAWRRFELDRHDRLFADTALRWAAVEFYLYYVRDTGLRFGGHIHDTEKLFVFVPGRAADAQLLRVVVGAGHSAVTPNNALVLTGPNAWKASLVHALVELGGHAMAPDLPPYGTFAKGHDANWYSAEDLWGTRDVLAISGRGSANDYEVWKQIPRDARVSVTLRPARSGPPKGDTLYALVPDTLLRTLFVSAAFGSLSEDDARASLGELERRLGWGPLATGHGADHLGAALRHMRRWSDRVVEPRAHHIGVVARLWPIYAPNGRTMVPNSGDEEYVFRPTAILKRRLFRGRSYFVADYGVDLARGGTAAAALGFGIPAPSLAGLYVRGTLTFQAGARAVLGDPLHRGDFLASVVYDAHHYRGTSWFLRLEYFANRDVIEERSVTDMAATVGATLRLPTASRRGWLLALTATKVRLGLRANLSGRGFDLGRVTPEIGISTNLLDAVRDF